MADETSTSEEISDEEVDDSPQYPQTLEGFGYTFNASGQLRHIETGDAFEYNHTKDKRQNQLRYEALGEVITNHVYGLLESVGLQRCQVPLDAKNGEATGFIFCSPDYKECDRMLVLIHGSGAVRAGQWARSLIINDNLSSGTQLPYIKQALDRKMGVVVMNTNQNWAPRKDDDKDSGGSGKRYIRGSEDSVSHSEYVWEHFITESAADTIAIVAHSAGGFVTCNLAKKFDVDFSQRVKAVCFTDSAYGAPERSKPLEPYWERMMNISCDWVCSSKPLGTELLWPQTLRYKLPTVSCGVLKHELSSYAAANCVWQFIDDRCGTTVQEEPSDDDEEEKEETEEVATAAEAGESLEQPEVAEEAREDLGADDDVVKEDEESPESPSASKSSSSATEARSEGAVETSESVEDLVEHNGDDDEESTTAAEAEASVYLTPEEPTTTASSMNKSDVELPELPKSNGAASYTNGNHDVRSPPPTNRLYPDLSSDEPDLTGSSGQPPNKKRREEEVEVPPANDSIEMVD